MRTVRTLVLGLVVLVSAGIVVGAEAGKPAKPKPGPEHKKLQYFAGNWTTEADLKESPFGPGGKVSTKDNCKWFEGGFAVVCNSTGTGPMGPSKGLGILGYSGEEKVYTYYGVDNSGMVPTSVARGTVEGDTWTYAGEDKMGGKTIKSRYTMKIESPDAYSFNWEMQGEDGKWNSAMEGKSTRVKAAGAKTGKK